MDSLSKHHVTTAKAQGWERLANGLLQAAEEAGFDLLLTTDGNMGSLLQWSKIETLRKESRLADSQGVNLTSVSPARDP